MITDTNSIFDEIEDLQAKARIHLKETQELGGHSCYGAGVEWGIIDGLEQLKNFINEED